MSTQSITYLRSNKVSIDIVPHNCHEKEHVHTLRLTPDLLYALLFVADPVGAVLGLGLLSPDPWYTTGSYIESSSLDFLHKEVFPVFFELALLLPLSEDTGGGGLTLN